MIDFMTGTYELVEIWMWAAFGLRAGLGHGWSSATSLLCAIFSGSPNGILCRSTAFGFHHLFLCSSGSLFSLSVLLLRNPLLKIWRVKAKLNSPIQHSHFCLAHTVESNFITITYKHQLMYIWPCNKSAAITIFKCFHVFSIVNVLKQLKRWIRRYTFNTF